MKRRRLLLIMVVVAGALTSVYFSRVWEPLVYEVTYSTGPGGGWQRHREVSPKYTWLEGLIGISIAAYDRDTGFMIEKRDGCRVTAWDRMVVLCLQFEWGTNYYPDVTPVALG